jgi:hypothetical protein
MNGGVEVDGSGYDITRDEDDLDANLYAWE